ncbi:hypothetical protein [Endozoicomonas acroporae]|nr:hypothetical protein [Endozoicomonas acroporae]
MYLINGLTAAMERGGGWEKVIVECTGGGKWNVEKTLRALEEPGVS